VKHSNEGAQMQRDQVIPIVALRAATAVGLISNRISGSSSTPTVVPAQSTRRKTLSGHATMSTITAACYRLYGIPK
jgi:hypothetical protein